MKLVGSCGLHHIRAQHEVLDVVRRQQDTLFTIQTAGLADVEESFDLFVDATHHLHLAVLI